VVATARTHCATRQFIALIGMSDQSFRIYITQYTQVNVLTRLPALHTHYLEEEILNYRLRYSDKV